MGANTNAPLILTIFGFYIVITVLFGLIGMGLQTQVSEISTPEEPSLLGFLSQIGFFVVGIGFTIGSIPFWANTILFLPLGVTVFYIGISFLRGSS